LMTKREGDAPLQLAAFYPIVPDLAWLEQIAPLGIKTVQLRLKDDARRDVRGSIAAAMAICTQHGIELIVNDDWREAIELGARAVHLGQEDLALADVRAIHAAGLYLGISTHSEAELEVAMAARPDYVALGPIYETKLKAMAWAPQGLERITAWKARIGKIPLVAIGGLTLQRAPGVQAAGADSLAVITDFVTSATPDDQVRAWVKAAAQTPAFGSRAAGNAQ
jgi:thiamine-phosphate pyrophosphorylase